MDNQTRSRGATGGEPLQNHAAKIATQALPSVFRRDEEQPDVPLVWRRMTFEQLGYGDQLAIRFDAPDALRAVWILWPERSQYLRRGRFGGRLSLDEFVERRAR